jgi:hypothetical protein
MREERASCPINVVHKSYGLCVSQQEWPNSPQLLRCACLSLLRLHVNAGLCLSALVPARLFSVAANICCCCLAMDDFWSVVNRSTFDVHTVMSDLRQAPAI